MAKRYQKAKTAKKAGKKTKAFKKSKAARKTRTAKKTKAVKKTRPAKRTKPVRKTKAARRTKTAKKKTRTKVQGFGNEVCVGERERVDAAKARVDSLFELLNNPDTTEDQKPQILENINQAETDFDAAQRALDLCIATTPIEP